MLTQEDWDQLPKIVKTFAWLFVWLLILILMFFTCLITKMSIWAFV